jgi:hypothetical protein
MGEYNYNRKLTGISEQWHKIVLPPEVFGKISQGLTDLRIFGLTQNNDTIEAPYLLSVSSEKVMSSAVGFMTLNTAYNEQGYYFTFEVPGEKPVNRIDLEFEQKNFDWRATLEGSHDQTAWFTLAENCRILSIKNDLTDYQFTKLAFPDARYRYVRIQIKSQEKPGLNNAVVSRVQVTPGRLVTYPIKKTGIVENKQKRHTEIDLEMHLPVRVGDINIGIADTFDYYRHVTIKYLADSFETDRGWNYNYSTLTSGTLSSMEENAFKFSSKTVQQLKIIIDNQANEPLTISSIEVKGYVHELVARFTREASYFLVYGNNAAVLPQYDIARFSDNIPETLTTLELGDELKIEKTEAPVTNPLFINEKWLWVVMIVIILLLGWFSIRMLTKR